MHNELTNFDISVIKTHAREKLGAYRKTNDVIGYQIFPILGLNARVLYYPLGKNAPWGVTRLNGSKENGAKEKPFVIINTSIPVSCQVFAAAHELYHIWYENSPDILPSDLLDEDGKQTNEKRANRFAAEFLMDEMVLLQEMRLHGIRKDLITIRSILQLSVLFTVPYEAMVRRLYELDIISAISKDELLSFPAESIAHCRKVFSLFDPQGDERISIDNLAELAVEAYNSSLITFEKLEFLLDICGLRPDEIGISPKTAAPFPADEELDGVMKEDE